MSDTPATSSTENQPAADVLLDRIDQLFNQLGYNDLPEAEQDDMREQLLGMAQERVGIAVVAALSDEDQQAYADQFLTEEGEVTGEPEEMQQFFADHLPDVATHIEQALTEFIEDISAAFSTAVEATAEPEVDQTNDDVNT